jgi:hypothetical protein
LRAAAIMGREDLQNVLSEHFNHVIAEFETSDSQILNRPQFKAVFRVNVRSADDVKSCMKGFEANSQSSWCSCNIRPCVVYDIIRLTSQR